MGTSTSLSTPSGGNWSPLKRDITSHFGDGTARCTPTAVVGQTIRAAGGVGFLSAIGGSGRSRGGVRDASGGRGRILHIVSGLGAFGASVATQGLDHSLQGLSLGELRGRPAVEVVARIAEQLSSDAVGLDRTLLFGALRDTLLEVANLQDSVDYQDLAESLGSFLETNGVEGLVETFLANLVYDQVWLLIEQWSVVKSGSNRDLEAFRAAVENACRHLVTDAFVEVKGKGRFDSFGWFGPEGVALAADIVGDVENRLYQAANEGA